MASELTLENFRDKRWSNRILAMVNFKRTESPQLF